MLIHLIIYMELIGRCRLMRKVTIPTIYLFMDFTLFSVQFADISYYEIPTKTDYVTFDECGKVSYLHHGDSSPGVRDNENVLTIFHINQQY